MPTCAYVCPAVPETNWSVLVPDPTTVLHSASRLAEHKMAKFNFQLWPSRSRDAARIHYLLVGLSLSLSLWFAAATCSSSYFFDKFHWLDCCCPNVFLRGTIIVNTKHVASEWHILTTSCTGTHTHTRLSPPFPNM